MNAIEYAAVRPSAQCASHDLAIEIVGLNKHYRQNHVVRDVSLSVPRGTKFGLIGPNGAGKSTTIKVLMGLVRGESGRIRVLGDDPEVEPRLRRLHVGYVPEQHLMHRWMRVGELLRFCRRFYPTWNDALCAELTRSFGLPPAAKVKHLSKGMLAKLSLLLALTYEPEVLVLDEPTSGLDPIAREEFLDGILERLVERDHTVLFSSHTLSDVQRIADVIAIIAHGRVLAQLPTDELLASTKRIRAVLRDGCEPAEPPIGLIWQGRQRREWLVTVRGFSSEVVEQLRSRNPVDHVEVFDLSLEDIFKDYVKGQAAAEAVPA